MEWIDPALFRNINAWLHFTVFNIFPANYSLAHEGAKQNTRKEV